MQDLTEMLVPNRVSSRSVNEMTDLEDNTFYKEAHRSKYKVILKGQYY